MIGLIQVTGHLEEGPNPGEESSVSIDDRPNTGDRASIDDRLNFGDRASIDDRPNLGQRASFHDRTKHLLRMELIQERGYLYKIDRAHTEKTSKDTGLQLKTGLLK